MSPRKSKNNDFVIRAHAAVSYGTEMALFSVMPDSIRDLVWANGTNLYEIPASAGMTSYDKPLSCIWWHSLESRPLVKLLKRGGEATPEH